MTEQSKKATTDLTVLSSFLIPLMQGEGLDVRKWTACVEELIKRNGGDPRVPARHVDVLWETVAGHTSDPVIAARLGTRLRPYRLGPMGQLLIAAKSGLGVLEALGNILSAVAPSTRVVIQQDRCVLNYDERGTTPAHQWPQFAMGFATAMLNWLAGDKCVIRAEFSEAPESSLQELEKLYGCQVATGCPNDGLVLRMDEMRRPFDTQD